jgi:iron complex outermembrane receptor protein
MLLFPILVSFLAAGAAAQTAAPSIQLTGRIADPSGAAVSGARVEVTPRNGQPGRRTVTGADGVYRFTSLAAGTYLLSAEAPQLVPATAEVTIPETGTVQQDFTLALAKLTARVVVTASSTAQSTDEVAKAFDVMDASQVDDRREVALAEALRLTPGMRIAQLGGPGALARVQTRGLRTFDTSVLIDGFRFRDVSAPQGDAMGFFGDLMLVDTARVEVLRGSGSSLYGTHAIGGVINAVTDSGGGPFHGDWLVENGGLGSFRTNAKLGGGAWNDRLRYTLGGMHWNVRQGVDGNDPYRNSSALASSSLSLTPSRSLSLRLFATDTFTALNVNPAALSNLPSTTRVPAIESVTFSTSLDDPDARRAGRFLSTLLSYTEQLSPRASLRAYYQGLTTRRDNRDGPGGPRFQPRFNTSNRFDGRVDTAQARTDVALARHQLAAGYEFERETYDNLSRDENPIVAQRTEAQVLVNQASHAVFAQDQWRGLNEKLHLSLSGRWQRFDLSRPTFRGGAPRYSGVALPNPPRALTGDVAVGYFSPGTGTKIRAHVGNSYRAPTLYERFGYSFFAGSFSAFGDPRIAPERAISLDGGIDQYLAGSRVRVSATYFYTRLQEVIGFDFSGVINPQTDPYGRSSGYRNTGGGLARGLELSGETKPTRKTRLQGSYTYTNADERNSTLIGGSIESIRISRHMATALATQELWRGIEVTMDLFAASDYVFPLFAGGSRPFVFDGPIKLDAVIRYRRDFAERTQFEVYTRIENVLNRIYWEDGFRTPKAWAVGGVRFRF